MTARVIPFRNKPASVAGSDDEALRLFAIPRAERLARAKELRLEDPEILLALCLSLKNQGEIDPTLMRDEAEFLYGFLDQPVRPIGLFDERDYFLGETALLAGVACRMLFRREEARRWFDRSESAFRQTVNAVADWARVSYQRLALRVEERDFDQVLELLPSLIQTFERLTMPEEALKSRFLEGVSFMNLERYDDGIRVFREICAAAAKMGNERLIAIACNNLVQLHALIGDSAAALEEAQQTLKLMSKLDNRVGLAKLQWGVGTLLRTQGNLAGAAEAFRSAQHGFLQLRMQSDVAALHLILADVLLESGDENAATHHVMEALPIIQAENMVPEGVAALGLLQESIRQRRVNPQALRELHGYFDEASR